MSKELVVGSNRHETKVAVLEDDQLVEIYFQRENEYSLAGSIHKGRVTRVLPGMQSAFVDLGLERDTFLYVSDFFEEHEDFEPLVEDKPVRGERRPPSPEPIEVIESVPPRPAVTALATSANPESRPAEKTDPDRGFQGDRRGRRSRRRRQRGFGFPENKYAQPGPSQPAVEPRPVPSRDPVASRDEEESKPADVIILPGESLAKYRHASAGPEEEAPVNPPNEIDPVEQEAIETEAEELATAEKVFGHHDEESVVDIEEKIEEVKEDQPEPPPSEIPETESTEDLEQIEPSEIEEIPEDEAKAETEPKDTTQTPAAQTASVREQGGRYMHRVSRRMRRRRGGNRFSQEGPQPASGGSAGVAAAPAIEPEPRTEARREVQEERSTDKPEQPTPSIADLLKPGQEIIVQIAKEPLGQKGARITSHVALPGRYVVFMPSVHHLGVSRRVSSEEERQRLKRILQTHRVGTTGGFIIRTAGEGVPEEEIAADMNYLYGLWLDIRQKAEKKPAPALLHYDLDIVQRILRDQVTEDFKAIWVDNEELYENVLNFMERFQPALVNRVKMYTRSTPIFDAFNITQELEKALRPKVWLKSGGYIVINQTEALVAIDINTGKYVGKSNRLEDTIVKTNTEAVKEIVRQIRLRDLGGIIVVDFIDMDERKNRQKVMQALEEAMRSDKAPYKILQFNDFGLVAITRKRVKQSLERTLCAPCPYCDGAGYVKSVQTIVSEILAEAQKISRAIEGKDVVLRVHPDVAKVLKASNNRYLEELEEILKRPVLVRGDIALHHEKFDLA